MLSVKQGSIELHFLSLWYDSTCDWTEVSRAIGEHSNHYANVRLNIYSEFISIYIEKYMYLPKPSTCMFL